MIEKYPGVMMPPSDEVTPEVKKAVDEAVNSRTIVIDNLPQANVNDYIKAADIDIAATYPSPEEIGEYLLKAAEDQRFANSKLVTDDSASIDKNSYQWGGIQPGMYSGTRGGITEANARILAGSKPDVEVIVNTPSQDIHFGNMSGHTTDWKEFKSETPYTEKPYEDRYHDQVMKAYAAHRGPFDFSLETELKNKELSDLAETTHVDVPVLWNPENVNHNGPAYTGAAQGATMRRILPELKGMLKHPDKVVLIEDTEMDMSKALAEAIIHGEVHHQDGFIALDKQGNFIDTEQAVRYGKRLHEATGEDKEVVHLNFGNSYHNSEQYVKDLVVENVSHENVDNRNRGWLTDMSTERSTQHRPGFNYMVADTGPDTEKVSVHGIDGKVEVDAELIDADIDVSLADPDKPKQKVVVLGHTSPRYLGAMLYNAIKDAGIDATVVHSADNINEGIAEPIRNTGSSSMKHLSPASVSLKHMQAISPYASGRKKERDDFMDERRLEMRNSQAKRNKAQGYGKRITKKDKGVDVTKAGLFSGVDVKALQSEVEFEMKMSITPEGVKALSKNQVIDGECTDIKSEDKE